MPAHASFLLSYLLMLFSCWVGMHLRGRQYADWALNWPDDVAESEYTKITLPVIWWWPLVAGTLSSIPTILVADLFSDITYLVWTFLFLVTGICLGFKSWINAWRNGLKTKFDPYYSLDIFGIKEDINWSVTWLRRNNRFKKLYLWVEGVLFILAVGSFVGLLRAIQRFVNGDGSRVVIGAAFIFLCLWGASVLAMILNWLIKLEVEGRLQQKLLKISQYYRLLQQRVKSLRS